jgi:hypothetical protein
LKIDFSFLGEFPFKGSELVTVFSHLISEG